MATPPLLLLLLPLLLFFLLQPCTLQLVLSASIVNYLPGFQGPLPFHLEAGYIGVGESEDAQLFYYFVKSERRPDKDPLLLWLTGGPGCSAWSGLVYEIGPLNYKIEKYNGSLPKLILNHYSWTKVSNIIFVDSPVGTGFSYSKTSSVNHWNDFKQLDDLFQFFKKWLINYPEFISNPVYIAGDSYAGMIVPALFQLISNGIKESTIPSITLKGYILGNPLTDHSTNQNYKIPFTHGMALISDELYKSLENNCRGEHKNIDPNNTKCLKTFQYYQKCIAGIHENHILELDCPRDRSLKPHKIRRWFNQMNSQVFLLFDDDDDSPFPPFGCRNYDHQLSRYWANNGDVRKALHIRKGSIHEWLRCNHDLGDQYKVDIVSSFQYHVNLSAKGYRSLIYSGDHDMTVPFLATQAWIKSLNYSIVDEWRSWIVEDQVAGFTRSYSNQMTFATVKGAGHTAPQYKQKECFAMFQRWINGKPL
ncbi:serine carboxypeptidase-like 7 isoform X1 [Humulus lupulus]|uniref:serine carboxypeptidase-like 7 isoform X1 n=1 Tax=Humulus lupulus TaxID=3486 RepID=UPI002B410CDD|nr:serine carboxypeptidase-like 7 isoform X1 [Humulus lupulus]